MPRNTPKGAGRKADRRPRRHYSDDFRAAALAALDANAGNVERTARALDVPPKTLEGWAKGRHNPVPAELRDQKRGELSDVLDGWVRTICGLPLSGFTELSLQQAGVAVGIAVDKLLLLTNRANQRSESANLNVNLNGPSGGWDWSKLSEAEIRKLADIRAKATGQVPDAYPAEVVDHDAPEPEEPAGDHQVNAPEYPAPGTDAPAG